MSSRALGCVRLVPTELIPNGCEIWVCCLKLGHCLQVATDVAGLAACSALYEASKQPRLAWPSPRYIGVFFCWAGGFRPISRG